MVGPRPKELIFSGALLQLYFFLVFYITIFYSEYCDRQAWEISVDSDHMSLKVTSEQGLHCLPLTVLWGFLRKNTIMLAANMTTLGTFHLLVKSGVLLSQSIGSLVLQILNKYNNLMSVTELQVNVWWYLNLGINYSYLWLYTATSKTNTYKKKSFSLDLESIVYNAYIQKQFIFV